MERAGASGHHLKLQTGDLNGVVAHTENQNIAQNPGGIHRYLATDHERLDALLERVVSDPGNIDAAAYAQFRDGLLKHIRMEEKVLFRAAQKLRRGGSASHRAQNSASITVH